MNIFSGLERGNKDCIGRGVKCNHDVLVAALGSGGETACIIRVQLADWFYGEMYIIGGGDRFWERLMLHFWLG